MRPATEIQNFRVTRDERAALAAAAAARGTTPSGFIREALVAAGVQMRDTKGARSTHPFRQLREQ